ncbi:MAG: hypothetical protein ACR2MC_12680 [Actinomycetota bacterium]
MRTVFGSVLLVGALLSGVAATSSPDSGARPLPGAPRCPVFPSNNPWNRRVDQLPLHPRSDAIVASIGLAEGLHPEFGSGKWEGAPIGIPFTTVPRSQKKVAVRFGYASESDPGPYPLPSHAPIEGGRSSVASHNQGTTGWPRIWDHLPGPRNDPWQ